MRKFLAVATALCLLASPALAGPRQAVAVRDAGPLVCGLIWNWEAPYCSTASVLFGSILWGAGIGAGVGAIAGAGGVVIGGSGVLAAQGTSAVMWSGAAIGATTGLVAPVILRR